MGGLQAGTIAPCWDHSSAPCLAAGTAPCCRKLSTGLGHVPWPPLSTARQRRHGPAPNRACRGLVTGRTSSEVSEAAVAKRAWRCPEVSGKHHHQISPMLQPLVLGVPAAKPAWGGRAPPLALLRWGKVTAAFFSSSSDGAAVRAPPVLPSTSGPGLLLPRPSTSSPGTSAAWGWPRCQLIPVQPAQPLQAESKHASMSNIIYL